MKYKINKVKVDKKTFWLELRKAFASLIKKQ